ncbi:YhjD/YihY/BrkB family envelope integrity protein [Brevibacterium sp. XM4083]|uniref:YhjD/YihY/BrkB family envelope integrity protein n=1 Tax=Brevibacterium sp. XM4083 TaxID=2583238 RepID=UPI0010F5E1F5
MTPAKILASRSPMAEAGHQAINQPGPAHLVRAVQRFITRLGNQFGAAITYFLVLAVIPIAMFTFAGLGFVLDVVRPDLVPVITQQIEDFSPGNSTLTDQLEGFLNDWQAVGIFGILAGLYTGQGFIGNLGAAVRAQLHDDFDDDVNQPLVKKFFSNTVTLLGLIVGLLLTAGLTVIGTGLRSFITDLFDLSGWMSGLLVVVPMIITFGASWLIFMFLFTMLPEHPVNQQAKVRGSLIGAVAFTILLNLATVLVDLFSAGKAAGVFGSIIAVMLTMNVFARIILFVAAWIGTAVPPPLPEDSAPHRRFVAPELQVQSLGALITGVGLVALTLLGFKRYDERRSRSAGSTR